MWTIKKETEQIHTEEIQDIIGAPPSWLVRWGIALFFSVLLIILGLSELINYPDLVKTQLKIRSFNLPKSVVPGVSGRLVNLLVQNNETVKAGQILAQMESATGKSTLIAPHAGRLVYAGIVHENEEFTPNQPLFFISSDNNSDFFGEMIIPQIGMGKIKEGQQVMVKFKSYPYEEYGILHGTIKYITDGNFKDGGYVAEVDFKNRNITDTRKILSLKQGMLADAEIITQNSSLLKRLTGNILKNITH
jgi:multidrug efflux pump subunit AcrA (membrane-fusion protein)